MTARITTMCYLEREGKYLMLFRNKKANDPNEGKWIGVGGKALPGETPEACIRREVLEETGFIVASFTARGMVKFVSDTWDDEDMYVFTANEFEAAPGTPLQEGLPLPDCPEGTLAWIPKEQVFNLPLWEGDRLFLRRLLAGDPDVSMTLIYQGDSLVDTLP